MLKVLLSKCKEATVSVLPVSLIVVILHMTPLIALTNFELMVFLISTLFLIIGIGLFNLGADLAMTPMGEQVGSGLARSRKLWLLLTVCFAMGLLITVAEPDLSVLAGQVKEVMNEKLLIITVGVGVGLFLLLAVIKIVFHVSLSSLLMFFYMLMFALALMLVVNGNGELLPLSFDSGGVTGGALTSAFLTPLTLSIAQSVAELNGSTMSILTNGFGIISFISVTPLIAVQLLGIIYNIYSKRAQKETQEESIDELLDFVEENDTNKEQQNINKGDEVSND